MNRRELLQLLGSAGVALVGPSFSGSARAQDGPNRHFIFVHAGGGWDPTALCDPKGDIVPDDERGPVNNYRQQDIRGVAGTPIRFAPFPDAELSSSNLRTDSPITRFDDFFNEVGPEMLVINGIDTQTNSHTIGTRTTWSGSATQGQPALAAMIARAHGGDSPLAFITNGGYDTSASLVAPARISGSDVLAQLAEPDRADVNPERDVDAHRTYYLPSAAQAIVEQQRAARRDALLQSEGLPQRRAAMARLFAVDGSDNGLKRLFAAMPDSLSGGLRGQAEVAVAAFQSQTSSCANLSVGGFDTHGDHDRNQTHRLAILVDGVHYLWQQIQAAGLRDRVTVLVSSDFGRRPFYNDGRGKDHWNVTSMLAFGAGVRGGRVFGQSSDGFRALKLDPNSLQAADDQDRPGLITLTPAHIHRAMRAMAGIEGTALAAQFPLEAELLPIFNNA